ncbi:MAG: bifunctional phosphoribosylaminoimidazolecarboxamide formyltransferase/IMP cyclohydrolase [Thermoguttaceae bacterium]
MESPCIKRALISVSDKLGLAGFARGLIGAGVEIFSTGGTRKHLESEALPVRDIADYTGFPEMMDGRLKTLHPKVHGGILCRHDNPQDMRSLAEHDILTFELVVVNLYPFETTVARKGVTLEEAIEQIDIGGPTLVRAAAKNHEFTTVATNTMQYSEILEQIVAHGCTTLQLRRRLAAEAFAHTANYDRAIANFFAGEMTETLFPDVIRMNLKLKETLRYGENPHQQAAVYMMPDYTQANVINAKQLHGKELSYNNLLDIDSALAIVRSFAQPAAVVIKHNNPCGAAMADNLNTALKRALAGDPLSAFGSVLGLNRTVDVPTAEALAQPGLFIEAIIAPDFQSEALEILTTKPKWKANVRLLKVGHLDQSGPHFTYRCLEGGALMQEADVLPDPEDKWQTVTEKTPSAKQMIDLRFAWQIVRHVKSNAIVLCKDCMLLGVGAGQMSRVDSTRIAIEKAGDQAAGAALASDAFFPFPDSIEAAANAGVSAVIQPGGSKKDDDVIAACNKNGIPMIFTGRRHFKH